LKGGLEVRPRGGTDTAVVPVEADRIHARPLAGGSGADRQKLKEEERGNV
jgi:hypothetical protein